MIGLGIILLNSPCLIGKIILAETDLVYQLLIMRRYPITNGQWEGIRVLSPPKRTGKRGNPDKVNPMMPKGMLWIASRRTVAQDA